MAFTDYYVDLADGGTGSAGTTEDPFSLADLTSRMTGGGAAVGDRYYIKGNATLSAAAVWTVAGTPVSPIVFIGVDASWQSLAGNGRTSNNKLLDTTSFPILTCAGYYLTLPANVVVANMDFTSSVNGGGVRTGANAVFWRCRFENSGTGANSRALDGGTLGTLIDCDGSLTGASGGSAVFYVSTGTALIGCRITASQNYGINFTGAAGIAIGCVIEPVTADAIYYSSGTTTNAPPLVYGCTIYGATGNGVSLAATAFTQPLRIINTILAGNAKAVYSAYDGTAQLGLVMSNCALKNTAEVDGFDDWYAGVSFKNVAPTTATSEFTDAANDVFVLADTALSKAAGHMLYQDIGALQRVEPAAGGGGLLTHPGMSGGMRG